MHKQARFLYTKKIFRTEKCSCMNIEKTIVYIVRHGESIGNLNKICLGHTDLNLTDLGLLQARKTFENLKDVDFTAIYSSDLIRAVNTAKPHAEYRNLPVETSPEFRELYFGDWENQSVEHLKEVYGDMFTVGWRQVFGDFTPPNGESVPQMANRMVGGIIKIASRHRGEKILVTSHAAAIRALWGKISGYKPHEWGSAYPFPSNASYSIVEVLGGVVTPVRYSVDEHLAEYATNIQH